MLVLPFFDELEGLGDGLRVGVLPEGPVIGQLGFSWLYLSWFIVLINRQARYSSQALSSASSFMSLFFSSLEQSARTEKLFLLSTSLRCCM